MSNRPSGTDGGVGAGAVRPSLYRPQQDWVPQNNDERQPQQYQEMQQSQLQRQQQQMGTGQLYSPPGSQVQTPSDPGRLQNEQYAGWGGICAGAAFVLTQPDIFFLSQVL